MTATVTLQEAIKAEVQAMDARLSMLFDDVLASGSSELAGAVAEALETSANIFRQLEGRVPPQAH